MKKGFTLIELIAAIAIIGLIALIVLPEVIESNNDSIKKRMIIQENNILDGVQDYLIDYCINPISNAYLATCRYERKKMFDYGDINNDGIVNNNDLSMLTNHINGSSSISGESLERADLDFNNVVNQNDKTLLSNYINTNNATPIRYYFCLKSVSSKEYINTAKYKDLACNGLAVFDYSDNNYTNGKVLLYCGSRGRYKYITEYDYNYSNYLVNCN